SLIAASGDTVTMPSNTLQMLHAPWGSLWVDGNAKQIREAADEFASVLEVFGKAMSGSYARKTGKPASEFDAMWDSGKDYWYTADEAKAFGLCDVVSDAAANDEDAEGADEAEARALAADVVAHAPAELARNIHAALRVAPPAAAAPRRAGSNPPPPRGAKPAPPPNPPAATAATPPADAGHTPKETAMNEEEIKAAAKKSADEALAALRTRN